MVKRNTKKFDEVVKPSKKSAGGKNRTFENYKPPCSAVQIDSISLKFLAFLLWCEHPDLNS